MKAIKTVLAAVLACLAAGCAPRAETVDVGGHRFNKRLLDLPANTWVKISEGADFARQGHAGMAYDAKRGTLLVFGSDTHGENWDNAVHEFDPVTLTWRSHYPSEGRATYRIDERGFAVAGRTRLLPWAMHTFDSVVYDPKLDALIVSAYDNHAPAFAEFPNAKHPTWIYDLRTHEWRIFGSQTVGFFAAASAYDSDRDTVVAYQGGVWEIGPERREWVKASGEAHHGIHYSLEYDTQRNKLVVFGDYGGSNAVWVYTPGRHAGEPGVWEKKIPTGDPCPPSEHFPAAYHPDLGVFLLVPEVVRDGVDGSSATVVYDPAANRYTRVFTADLKPLGMNYMMAYDRFHRIFLLVAGGGYEPTSVWALMLDPTALPQ